jgi:hypothetical protein
METFITRKEPLFKITLSLNVLMIIQALGGFVIPYLYRDSKEVIASWRGNDLVTLFVAVPVILWAVLCSQKKSVFAKYVWFAMLFYIFYNNCFYLFGASLNYFFFIYIAIFVLSITAILIAASHYYNLNIIRDFQQSKSLRIVVVCSLFLFGVLMAGLWIGEWIQFALFGTKPTIPGMDEGYSLVATMDLTTQIPIMFTGAVLLWRNKPLGYLLSFISTASNTVYLLVLLAFPPFAERAGLTKAWDGFPMFSFILILCVISTIMFYRNIRKSD